VRVRILLQTAPDDGASGEMEEVATFEKSADRLEEVGLSLAEAEALLAAVQRRTVASQATAHVERHRCRGLWRAPPAQGRPPGRVSGS
jgi:hypothetical protein